MACQKDLREGEDESTPRSNPETGGEMLIAMYGGGSKLYDMSESELLDHVIRKRQIVVYHAAKTRKDHENAIFPLSTMFLAIIPCTMLLILIGNPDNTVAWAMFVLPTVAIVALHKFIIYFRDKGIENWGWDMKKWIDLDARLFIVEHETFGRNPMKSRKERPLEELAILGKENRFWESGASYDLSLVHKAQVNYKASKFAELHMGHNICKTDELGMKLAKVWGITYISQLPRSF